MVQPHWTLVDFVDIGTVAGLASTPLWLAREDALHLHLEVASCLLACIYVSLRILQLIKILRRGRVDNGDEE